MQQYDSLPGLFSLCFPGTLFRVVLFALLLLLLLVFFLFFGGGGAPVSILGAIHWLVETIIMFPNINLASILIRVVSHACFMCTSLDFCQMTFFAKKEKYHARTCVYKNYHQLQIHNPPGQCYLTAYFVYNINKYFWRRPLLTATSILGAIHWLMETIIMFPNINLASILIRVVSHACFMCTSLDFCQMTFFAKKEKYHAHTCVYENYHQLQIHNPPGLCYLTAYFVYNINKYFWRRPLLTATSERIDNFFI